MAAHGYVCKYDDLGVYACACVLVGSFPHILGTAPLPLCDSVEEKCLRADFGC